MMDSRSGPPVTITLVASTVQEKAAWCSDISQASQVTIQTGCLNFKGKISLVFIVLIFKNSLRNLNISQDVD